MESCSIRGIQALAIPLGFFAAGCACSTVGWPALVHPQFPAHLVSKAAQEVRKTSQMFCRFQCIIIVSVCIYSVKDNMQADM